MQFDGETQDFSYVNVINKFSVLLERVIKSFTKILLSFNVILILLLTNNKLNDTIIFHRNKMEID